MSEQERNDDAEKNEELAGLELAADQAEQTKAGTFAGGQGTGKVHVSDIQVSKDIGI